MKYRHHPALHLLIPGEVARGTFWENLRHGLLKFVGDPAIFVGVIVILVFLIACLGLHGPVVAVRSMVEYDVQHEVHALRMHGLTQGHQIFQCPESWIYLSEIRNRIATITFSLRAFEERHQVKKIYSQVLQVWKFGRHGFEAACKAVHVHAHPCQILTQKPIAFGVLVSISLSKRFFPSLVTQNQASQKFEQLRFSFLMSPIEFLE